MNDASSIAQSRVQAAHLLFRSSAEVTKRLRQIALGSEVMASGLAAYGVITGEALFGGWGSLLILSFMVGATALRVWSRSTQAYSERCRRVSARAFAEGRDIGATVLSGLVADAPIFARGQSNRTLAGTLDDYYEPTKPVGEPRLQEIYAHSALYSWRLLRTVGQLLLVIGTAFAVTGALVIYGLAVDPPSAATAARVLEVVCSLVFIVLSGKGIDSGIAALVSARDVRSIADGLVATADSEEIAELTSFYDISRSSGPLLPTWIYSWSRDSLQTEWHAMRAALDELPLGSARKT